MRPELFMEMVLYELGLVHTELSLFGLATFSWSQNEGDALQ